MISAPTWAAETCAGGVDGQTTGVIANKLESEARKLSSSAERNFYEAAAHALRAASEVRNDVLHARPATDPHGRQRLLRCHHGIRGRAGTEPPTQFWISDEWLYEKIGEIEMRHRELSALRLGPTPHDGETRE